MRLSPVTLHFPTPYTFFAGLFVLNYFYPTLFIPKVSIKTKVYLRSSKVIFKKGVAVVFRSGKNEKTFSQTKKIISPPAIFGRGGPVAGEHTG